MFEKIPDSTATFMLLGGIGGLVRLALGIKEDGVTVWNELFRWLVIALPIATLAGLHAESKEWGFAAYPIAYFAGTASLNIARTVMTQGISGIIDAFVRVKK